MSWAAAVLVRARGHSWQVPQHLPDGGVDNDGHEYLLFPPFCSVQAGQYSVTCLSFVIPPLSLRLELKSFIYLEELLNIDKVKSIKF